MCFFNIASYLFLNAISSNFFDKSANARKSAINLFEIGTMIDPLIEKQSLEAVFLVYRCSRDTVGTRINPKYCGEGIKNLALRFSQSHTYGVRYRFLTETIFI